MRLQPLKQTVKRLKSDKKDLQAQIATLKIAQRSADEALASLSSKLVDAQDVNIDLE